MTTLRSGGGGADAGRLVISTRDCALGPRATSRRWRRAGKCGRRFRSCATAGRYEPICARIGDNAAWRCRACPAMWDRYDLHRPASSTQQHVVGHDWPDGFTTGRAPGVPHLRGYRRSGSAVTRDAVLPLHGVRRAWQPSHRLRSPSGLLPQPAPCAEITGRSEVTVPVRDWWLCSAASDLLLRVL